MKKLNLLFLIYILAFSIQGCSEDESKPTQPGMTVGLEHSRILDAENSHLKVVISNIYETQDPSEITDTDEESIYKKEELIKNNYSKALYVEVVGNYLQNVTGTVNKNGEQITYKNPKVAEVVNRNKVVILRHNKIQYVHLNNENADDSDDINYEIIHNQDVNKNNDKVKFFTYKENGVYKVEILIDAISAKKSNDITLLINGKPYTLRNYEVINTRDYSEVFSGKTITTPITLKEKFNEKGEVIPNSKEYNIILKRNNNVFYYAYSTTDNKIIGPYIGNSSVNQTEGNFSFSFKGPIEIKDNSYINSNQIPNNINTKNNKTGLILDYYKQVKINNTVNGEEEIVKLFSCEKDKNDPLNAQRTDSDDEKNCGIKISGGSSDDYILNTSIIHNKDYNVKSNIELLINKSVFKEQNK